VVQRFNQLNAEQRTAAIAPFIAADVGGTHARIGLVLADAHGAMPIAVAQYHKYVCADYPSLSAILRDFLDNHCDTPVEFGAIACAGYLLDDTVINANLPWKVSLADIRNQLGLKNIALVNDFTAVAHATQFVNTSDMIVLAAARGEPIAAPTLVVGPGTGLGAAVQIPGKDNTTILSTEAGQAAFAPSSEIEIEILSLLRRQMAHVSIETVLSGPGLVNIYSALCTMRSVLSRFTAPAQITQAALDDSDATALEALQVFCGLMGSIVGDLVLLYGAQGGVYLAGGILPQIRDFLINSTFAERFHNKGAMRELLERVPVRLIEHGQLGVIGAASWYLDSRGMR